MITFTIDKILLDKTIFDVLRELKFDCGYTGYKYVVDYLRDCFDRYAAIGHNDLKMCEWYNTTATRYNTTPGAIERALRYSIRNAVANNSPTLEDIFATNVLHNGKVEASRTFLNGVYQYLLANCVTFGFGYSDEKESEDGNI